MDLATVEGHLQPGIVLIGDAFQTSCPAAGTGVSRLLVDVERLCTVHLPEWLKTDGMSAEKIAQFYSDPEKTASDARAFKMAFFRQALTVDGGMRWNFRRRLHFLRRNVRHRVDMCGRAGPRGSRECCAPELPVGTGSGRLAVGRRQFEFSDPFCGPFDPGQLHQRIAGQGSRSAAGLSHGPHRRWLRTEQLLVRFVADGEIESGVSPPMQSFATCSNMSAPRDSLLKPSTSNALIMTRKAPLWQRPSTAAITRPSILRA